jgi:DICT domain-containing protein
LILTSCWRIRNKLYDFLIADLANRDLGTAQLAHRTGLNPGTLRMWESRYGFPAPPRQPGRHRRYSETDAEQVREVLRLRTQGLSLSAAIEWVRAEAEVPPASLFAELRRRHPEIQAFSLPKSALLHLSRAIEDEYRASGSSGLLLGSFQREAFYRQTQRRWRELARGAAVAVAMADFKRLDEPADGPAEVPVERAQPLAHEWTLIVDAPAAQACLAAWEHALQGTPTDSSRRFEVMWSFDPRVVRSSTRIAAALVRNSAPAIAARIERALSTDPAAPAAGDLRFASSLANRIVAYLTSGQSASR